MNQRGEQLKPERARRGYAMALVALVSVVCVAGSTRAQRPSPASVPEGQAQAARTEYRINLSLDLDGRTYTGTERVRWTNDQERPAYVLYFHL